MSSNRRISDTKYILCYLVYPNIFYYRCATFGSLNSAMAQMSGLVGQGV